jgi:hypothetical protein
MEYGLLTDYGRSAERRKEWHLAKRHLTIRGAMPANLPGRKEGSKGKEAKVRKEAKEGRNEGRKGGEESKKK